MAKKAEVKKTAAPVLLDKSVYAKGVSVKYTGSRTQFAGQTGVITGYRGPTTGLWVKFPSGVGSISCRNAEVTSPKAPRARKAAKAALPVSGGSEPTPEPTPETPSA